jgi:hypothetical protein
MLQLSRQEQSPQRFARALRPAHAPHLAGVHKHLRRRALRAGLITRSGFFRSAPSSFIGIFDFVTNDVLGVAETVQGGGGCLAFMAVDPSLESKSGVYYNNETSGIPLISPGHKFTEQLPSEEAQRDGEAARLWELSAILTNV